MNKLKYLKYIVKILVPLLLFASIIFAEGINIGTGAKLRIGSGTLNVPSNININGTLEAVTGTINIGGNWNNYGLFTPGTGTVNFIDGRSPVNITGATAFYNFYASTNTGKQINFETTGTQTITNNLSLNGASSNLLILRSTENSKQAKINLQPGATQTISYIDVKDNFAQGQSLAPGSPLSYNSIDSGNNYQWFFISPTITVSPYSTTLIVDQTLQFNVSGGTSPYTWSIDNPGAGTINTNGLLTPLVDEKATSNRTCYITATDKNAYFGTSGLITILWDNDGDKLPDAWEVNNNLNPRDPNGNNGWNGDPDGDGVINGDEWQYGFNPQNSSSPSAPTAPSINSYGPQNAQGEVALFTPWLSVNNSVYDKSNNFYNNIKYKFEVYTDSALTQVYTSLDKSENILTTITLCVLEKELAENTTYWWRAWSYIGNIKSNPTNTASFFVNTKNEPPTQVKLSYPPDGSNVSSLSTKLEVTNASDPDRDTITYDFKLYDDKGFLFETTKVPETAGTTSSNTPTLKDNTQYKWTACSRDEHDSTSTWMNEATFFVNTANEAPLAPEIKSPPDSTEVNSQIVKFTVKNTLDSDGDKVSYFFEADTTNNFNSNAFRTSKEVTEGTGETSWQAENLTDNTYWYWRVKSYDGSAYSSWVNAKIFVNTANDAPSIPVILSPKETIITNIIPELKIYPSSDIDRDEITYEYAVYDTSRNKVTGATGQNTSWIVDKSLSDNSKYFWHSQAIDKHGLVSGFSDTTWFFVNQGNNAPSAPILVSPAKDSIIETQTPELEITNAKDADGDILTYHFQVFDNELFLGNVIKEIDKYQENPLGKTIWKIDIDLPKGKKYYWRVQAHDGTTYGSWSETFNFNVKAPAEGSGGDTSGSGKSGPCVITNMINKTSHPEMTKYISRIKDKYISKSDFGKWITGLYYKLSPCITK